MEQNYTKGNGIKDMTFLVGDIVRKIFYSLPWIRSEEKFREVLKNYQIEKYKIEKLNPLLDTRLYDEVIVLQTKKIEEKMKLNLEIKI